MTIYYEDDHVALYHGDCLDVLAAMPDSSVDSIVTDPPYGLSNTTPAQVAETITRWVSGDREYLPTGRGFMGKEWDGFVPPVAVWDECLRVLKPGGHMAVFAGSRTHDLMTLSIRFAGFEIRDSLAWLYGAGFPKSHDVSKAIDKLGGAKRPRVPYSGRGIASGTANFGGGGATHVGTKVGGDPITPEAKQWSGWGTALKPAFEPIVLARKPLEGTVARNVLEHGTGGINIDACRIAGEANRPIGGSQGGILRLHGCHSEAELRALAEAGENTPDGRDARKTLARYIANRERNESSGEKVTNTGRWPANVLLDEHAAAWVDEQSGTTKSTGGSGDASGKLAANVYGDYARTVKGANAGGLGDSGGASRFFYTAKAPKSERPNVDGIQHPTVKPLAIMRWLIRLVTPPGGTILDPFAGSGTTIEAAMIEGFHPIGIEKETDYLPLITARITRAKTSTQGVLDLGGIA